jgi:outer membrane protein OmpA-like peptidoglycan-associated protein
MTATVTTLLSAAARYTIVSVLQNGRVDISIARIISGKAAAMSRSGRLLLILPAAVALFAAAPTLAQNTIYIGGSGQTGVEINLHALDQYTPPRSAVFGLRHPVTNTADLAPVTLRPPSDEAQTATASAPVPVPVTISPIKPITPSEPAQNLATFEPVPTPEPAPAALPVVDRASDPDQMTKEERAAAIARNKNEVSSTSFANELARSGSSNTAASKTVQQSATTTTTVTAAKQPAEKAATKSAAAKPANKTQMAALNPADVPTMPGQSMQITFTVDEATLPGAAQAALAAIAARLAADDTLRLQLKAYAGGGAKSASHARRVSLSRALAVRSELIEQGVRSTRIDVRALGNKSKNGTSDRVDVILVQR